MANVKVLDGGFSTQLKKCVTETVDGDPLWTAKFLVKQPEVVSMVQRDFVIAGAELLASATYQSSIQGYQQYLGLTKEEATEVIKSSVKISRDGVKMAEEMTGKHYNVQIAGEVGPYGAFLHDGSEYTGKYCDKVTIEHLMDWHRGRLTALVEADSDLIAFVTIPCMKEAIALIRLLKEFPSMKAWLSFSIKDSESISSGENFIKAAEECWKESSQLIAIGANCFHPSLVTSLFKPLREKHPEIPLIVYPNNGDKYDTDAKVWRSNESGVNIEDYVEEWLELGITYIGGCCQTDDQDICKMSKRIHEWVNKRKDE